MLYNLLFEEKAVITKTLFLSGHHTTGQFGLNFIFYAERVQPGIDAQHYATFIAVGDGEGIIEGG